MDRMKILKNPDITPKFCPVVPLQSNFSEASVNYLLPFRHFEALRNSEITWSEFLNRFDIRNTSKTAFDRLNETLLGDLFSKLEHPSIDRRVHFIFVSSKIFSDIRFWDTADLNGEFTLIGQGLMGHIFGAEILVNVNIPFNKILISSEDCIGATLELSQETFTEARELAKLEENIREKSQELNSMYRRMIDIIHNTVNKIENRKVG